MNTHVISELAWERMVTAVEKVRQRLRRATQALENAAVRNTQDVDILLRRADLDRAKEALAKEGFVYRHSAGIDMFMDGAHSKARDAVHIAFAGERIRKEYEHAAPDVDEAKNTPTARVVNLDALVRMKLTSFRRKDQVHVLDLINVGLVDATWIEKLPADLAARLQELLDNPES
jgi:hypothetical protein